MLLSELQEEDRTESSNMSLEPKNLGICSTCDHVEDCLHRFENGMVIWFCEQFETYTPPKSIGKPIDMELSSPNVEQYCYLGLCANCEQRNDCVHAKTPGGIWHCEEYR